MKNITKSVIALFAVLALSCSVEDVEDRPVIQGVDTPELVAPENDKSYVLLEENADDVAERFVWTKATYGGDVEIGYKLLIDVKGGDFTKAIELGGTSGATQIEVTVKILNQAVIELGGTPDQLGSYDIKVVSSLAGIEKMMSETPLTILVNAYTGLIPYEFTDWYLIGAAVQGDWTNNADTKHQPMFRNGTDASKYSFTGYFSAGNFKLISKKGSWDSQLGRASATAIELNGNAGEFTIATAGYYKFVFDTTALTYTLVAYNASAAPTFSTVGIIGSSTPNSWDASTALTQSTFNAHVWSLDILGLVDGEAKFRANDKWDVSWGGKTAFSGGGTGDNIPVTKSKYTIYFNDLDGSYLMIPNQE
ncbi:SusE domain-containing protein [Flavobacterium yafengii]|uniref:SusE domain-containing protein n=1 Tax=Flavobacterium yafengii TaxID=3041253 RepID=UPI0024A7C24D|nr:SusE domain-containing protein [Flavobacterium yafengii]MDI5898974.1 SusE domain-containing protein [Flavobacterium yafengii]